jgi:hypothetical protein
MLAPAIGSILESMFDVYRLKSGSQAILQLNQQIQQHAGIETTTEGKMIAIGPGQLAQGTL